MIEREKYDELKMIMVGLYFMARNGLPDPPRYAKEIEERKNVAVQSYKYDCVCRAAVDRATACVLEVFHGE